MEVSKSNAWSEQDRKFSSKPVYVIRPYPIDPTKREIKNGIVKPKMNR